jgi:hypothetical protein
LFGERIDNFLGAHAGQRDDEDVAAISALRDVGLAYYGPTFVSMSFGVPVPFGPFFSDGGLELIREHRDAFCAVVDLVKKELENPADLEARWTVWAPGYNPPLGTARKSRFVGNQVMQVADDLPEDPTTMAPASPGSGP